MVSTQKSKGRIGLPISDYIHTETGGVADINTEKKIVYIPVKHKVLVGENSGHDYEFTNNFHLNADKIDDIYYLIGHKVNHDTHDGTMLCQIGVYVGVLFNAATYKYEYFQATKNIIHTFDKLIRGDELEDINILKYTGVVNLQWCVAVPVIPIVIGGGFDEMDAVGDEGNTDLGLVDYTPFADAVGIGSCNLWDTDASRRVYGKDYKFSGDGFYIENGLIKITWIPTAGSKEIKFYSNIINEWYAFATINLDDNYDYNFYIKKNTQEELSIVIQRYEKDNEKFTITIKKGSPLVHLEGTADWNTNNEIVGVIQSWQIIHKGNDTLDCVESSGWHSLNLTTGSDSYYLIINKFLQDATYGQNQQMIVIGRKKVTTDCQWYIIHGTQNRITKVKNILDDDVFLGVLPNPYVYYNWMECEDMSATSGAIVADVDASGGDCVQFDTHNEYVLEDMNYCHEAYLPKGKYKLFVRAKDTTQIANDLEIIIQNVTDTTTLISATKTLTASYGWYNVEFEINADDDDDQIRIKFFKDTASVNTISVDEYFIIPFDHSEDSLSHQDFIDGKWGIAKSYLKQVTQKISHARRD